MKTAASWLVTTLLSATLVVVISLSASPAVLGLVHLFIVFFLFLRLICDVESGDLPRTPSRSISKFKKGTETLLYAYTSVVWIFASISMVTLSQAGLTGSAAITLLVMVAALVFGARAASKHKALADNITAAA